MPKRVIDRADMFEAEDEEAVEVTGLSRDERPYMPMDEADRVRNNQFPSTPHISPKVLLEQEKAHRLSLEQQLATLQQQLANQTSGLALRDGGIVVEGFQFSPTGLIAPEGFTAESWEQVGLLLFRLEGSIQWLIGDWLVYGIQRNYGDVKRFATYFERDEHTLYNYMNTSRSVESSLRNELLSYNHHVAVAKLAPEEQAIALAYALENGENGKPLAVAKFRQWLKNQIGGSGRVLIEAQNNQGEHSLVDVSAVVQGANNLFRRDPSTFKPQDREMARQHVGELYRIADALKKHAGIE